MGILTATVRDQLGAKRSTLLKAIHTEATAGNSAKILALSDELRRVEQLLSQHDSWVADAEILLSSAPAPHQAPLPSSPAQVTRPAAGRAHGKDIRAGFLRRASAAGLPLSPYQGAIYRASAGTRVGIAVATERNPNRWFLGLSQGDYDSAVLLCQTETGRTFDVCLPGTFVKAHRFSRSGGQDKFNVVRREGHLFLTIPGSAPVPVDQYVGSIAGLK